MADVKPLPCFVCDELPRVGGFLLMDGRTGWTALCPNKHFETNAYYDRNGAVAEWNAWVEGEGCEQDGEL